MPKLNRQMEDVLCAIYTIELTNTIPRNAMIGKACNMPPNLVTHWGKKLAAQGLVQFGKWAYYALTEDGLPLAIHLYQRRMALATALQEVFGVSEELALEQADAWEHDLTEELGKKVGNGVLPLYH